MNGLKTLNEAVNHEAGDAALREIGKTLEEISSKNIFVYRTGGDEFSLLFIHLPENTVHETMEKLRGLLSAKGYYMSTGYAMRGWNNISVEDMIRLADENMRADKAAYYRIIRHDRRKQA